MSTRYIFGRLVCGFVLVITAVPSPPGSPKLPPLRLRSSSAMRGASGKVVGPAGSVRTVVVMVRPTGIVVVDTTNFWPPAPFTSFLAKGERPPSILKTPASPFQPGNLLRFGTKRQGTGSKDRNPPYADSHWLSDHN